MSDLIQKKSKRGGARPGAGRPKGAVDRVTVAGLLAAIETHGHNQTYMDMLAQDFADARASDRHLAMKYHNLILNKVAPTLAAVEVSDSADTLQQRQQAFQDALAVIVGKDSR